VALALAAAAVAAIAVWIVDGDSGPAVAVLVLEGLFVWPLRERIDAAIRGTEAAAHELDLLANLLQRLEHEAFRTPTLAALRRELDTGGAAASQAILALDRLIELHDWQHNLIFRVLSLPLMWRLQVAFAIERWRRIHGRHVSRWIASVAEFEALASLAAYGYEHPDDPFPEISASTGGSRAVARFEGTALGHPLLPAARTIRNSVHLDERTRLFVVSGSNMSGKSTLLRTVGINAVLALGCSSCSTSCFTAPTRTIGSSARRACSAACSIAAPSA
jgi:hypothetical protein